MIACYSSILVLQKQISLSDIDVSPCIMGNSGTSLKKMLLYAAPSFFFIKLYIFHVEERPVLKHAEDAGLLFPVAVRHYDADVLLVLTNTARKGS